MPKKKVNSGLKILFQEVLEGMPEGEAERLMEGYSKGLNIAFVIGQSAFGADKKTAFAFALTDSQDWRGLPEPAGGS